MKPTGAAIQFQLKKVLTPVEDFGNHSLRKKLSENRLRTPPTKSEDAAISKVDDCGMKVRIPISVQGEKKDLTLSSALPSRSFTQFIKKFRINLIA